MFKKEHFLISSIFLLTMVCMNATAFSQNIPQMPFRIGGTLTVDNVQITQDTDDGYEIKVTKQDGSVFTSAAEDTDGLNDFQYYTLDIPIYDAATQPEGANPGDIAILHVFLNSKELDIISPDDGEVVVGDSGSWIQIDIEAESGLITSTTTSEQGPGPGPGPSPTTSSTSTISTTSSTSSYTTTTIELPVPCEISITPETVEVISGQTLSFSIEADGDCSTPDYEWSVESSIGSKIDQDGTYTAGLNLGMAHAATDVVKVVDHGNGDLPANATVEVSLCPAVQLYGESSQEVKSLRKFRDGILSTIPEGRELIKLYYKWTPLVVKAMEEDEEFKRKVKETIDEVLLLIK